MVLEHDFIWKDHSYDHDSLASFIATEDWDVIRFGYCPRPFGVFLDRDGLETQMTDDVTCRNECLSDVIPNTDVL